MLIQDRVKLIMQTNKESSSSFADKIGVKRSNLSHVLSGRNKPSLDFLEKIINYYPNVNASWLVTGKTRSEESEKLSTNVNSVIDKNSTVTDSPVIDSKLTPEQGKEIEKVIVFYTDGKIKEYNYG